MKSKQVIVMRKDLGMRKGKMIAQGAHASIKFLIDSMVSISEDGFERKIVLTSEEMKHWIDGSFTKICVGIDSEAELEELYLKAHSQCIPVSMIVDNGLTEFGGVKTKTCIAIGPSAAYIVDSITAHLKLL